MSFVDIRQNGELGRVGGALCISSGTAVLYDTLPFPSTTLDLQTTLSATLAEAGPSEVWGHFKLRGHLPRRGSARLCRAWPGYATQPVARGGAGSGLRDSLSPNAERTNCPDGPERRTAQLAR